MEERQNTFTAKQKKIIAGTGLLLFIALLVLVFVYAGKPMVKFISDPRRFRAWVDEKGLMARILFMGMVLLQVIVAFIPGEPFEIAAGYAFGMVEGTILCLVAITAGSMLVFLLVRKLGIKLVEVFFPMEKIHSMKFLQNSTRINFLVFFIFFIPGTPKDLLAYFVGLTKIKPTTWLLITSVARIPSVITSTIGGNALGMQDYSFAILVFSVTLLLSGLGILIYRVIRKRHTPDAKENIDKNC